MFRALALVLFSTASTNGVIRACDLPWLRSFCHRHSARSNRIGTSPISAIGAMENGAHLSTWSQEPIRSMVLTARDPNRLQFRFVTPRSIGTPSNAISTPLKSGKSCASGRHGASRNVGMPVNGHFRRSLPLNWARRQPRRPDRRYRRQRRRHISSASSFAGSIIKMPFEM